MRSKDALLDDLRPSVRSAARQVASKWPGTIEADDVEQELMLRLLGISHEALNHMAGQPSKSAVSALARMGNQIAGGYRDDHELFSGNYHYSGDEVRKLLAGGALVFADELTSTERADISNAMHVLSRSYPHYAEALFRKFAVQDDEADRFQVNRALRALTREMNRSFNRAQAEHEGPALRKDQR